MGLFDFLNDVLTVKTQLTNINMSMPVYAPQNTLTYSPTTTYTLPIITPTLQYNPQFLINSAGASAAGGVISPSVTTSQVITPTTQVTPTQTTTPSQTATASQGMGGLGGIDWTTIAIVGAVVVGAYLIFGRGSKGKENRQKVKGYAKKGVKYGAKAAKYAAMMAV